ncbi:MAG: hypothetical protein KC713_07545, partial [Candidatus Omnitrophica bacterium]|nr:hypothetical protein [Candidatus Omnitrophota bacterium]
GSCSAPMPSCGEITFGLDNCGHSCEVTSGPCCGDNIINNNEVCDGNSQNCQTSDGYPGTQECDTQCLGFSACVSSEYCGDGIANGDEVCDSDSRNCTDPDGYAGAQDCSQQCTGYNTTCISFEYCGDGVMNGNETCDSVSQNCTTPDGYAGSQLCQQDCTGFNTCSSFEYCGDGVVNGNESCDDGNTSSGDGCSSQCVIEQQQNCMTTQDISNDTRCLYIYQGKVYLPDDGRTTRQRPHEGIPCESDVTTYLPGFHSSSWLNRSYVSDLCQ